MEDYVYNNFNMSNSSYLDDYEASDWCLGDTFTIKMFQTCVFCFIFLLGMMGNSLVIATFALYRRLRLRSMTDVFLLHLAVADLLLLLTLPLQATDTHLGWIFSDYLCKATRACYTINTYSGLLLLACISIDRYLVVARAHEMLRLRRWILRGSMMAAVGVWVVATLLSFPELRFAGVSTMLNEDNKLQQYCGMIKSGRVKMATNIAIIGVFCLSFVIMAICYTSIARVLWEGSAHRRGKQWHRQRTLRLMVSLVLVFLLFQLPYTVVLSHKVAGQFCGLLLEYITCTLAYTRCCLNPILYALVGVRFRNDVMRLMQNSGCCCGPNLALIQVNSTSITPTTPTTPTMPTTPTTPNTRVHVGLTVSSPKFPECSETAVIPTKLWNPGTD